MTQSDEGNNRISIGHAISENYFKARDPKDSFLL